MKAPFRPFNKRSWSQPLADLVSPLIAPALAKQGFGEADIIMHWPEIVGPRLAALSEPIRLQWPSQGAKPAPDRTPDPAVLHVRVDGGMAIEMQHMAGIIIERVNAHLGWRAVGRLALKQGPLAAKRAAKRKRVVPDAASVSKAARAAEGVENDALREALTKFGANVIAGRKG